MNPDLTRSFYLRRLRDAAVDAYDDWREECGMVWEAYARWAGAPAAEARSLFKGYSAALEREERAADVYAAHLRQVSRVMQQTP